jgi:hypothetical protein
MRSSPRPCCFCATPCPCSKKLSRSSTRHRTALFIEHLVSKMTASALVRLVATVPCCRARRHCVRVPHLSHTDTLVRSVHHSARTLTPDRGTRRPELSSRLRQGSLYCRQWCIPQPCRASRPGQQRSGPCLRTNKFSGRVFEIVNGCAQVTSGGGGKGSECKRHRCAAKETTHRRQRCAAKGPCARSSRAGGAAPRSVVLFIFTAGVLLAADFRSRGSDTAGSRPQGDRWSESFIVRGGRGCMRGWVATR